MRYVIIGNSAAFVGCVEGIRQVDRDGEITVIGDESERVYSRPLISYMLQGKVERGGIHFRPYDFYEKNGVTALLGKKAVSIDVKAKTVALEGGGGGGGGTAVAYDKLLVATGSRPFIPPFDGLDRVNKKFTFMTVSDAEALRDALNKAYKARVLIVGAGLIGLKCAEGISGLSGKITVVDMADRVLSAVLDERGAKMIQDRLQENGVSFRLGQSVKSFTTPNEAVLSGGEAVGFDVLVLAVGVRANVEPVKDAGGDVGRGIIVNERLETSLPDVYAAGDCTEGFDAASRGNAVLALLPNAYAQGEAAGLNMAGRETAYNNAIAQNAAGFFGLHIITAGVYKGESHVSEGGGSYRRLFVDEGRLTGVIAVGDVTGSGIYANLIRQNTPLNEVDFELLKVRPTLAAFGSAYRAEKLGGRRDVSK